MLQPPIPPTPAGVTLAGKTVIVTGGNAGLGFEAARQFLTLHAARVILACRSLSRGEKAAAALRADPEVQQKNPNAVVEVFELDLADYQSGLRFAQKVKKEVRELDILLNNAGQVLIKYTKAPTGHEMSMQVNCYTQILITLELLPLLRGTAKLRGSPTRVTFTGSNTHVTQETVSKRPVKPDETTLGHFDDPAHFSRFYRYADTKLCIHAYVRKLAQIAPDEVIVNNLCPGMVQTGLDKNLPLPLRITMVLVRKGFGRTVQEGARTLVYAAAVAGKETNGKYLQHNQIHQGAAYLSTPEGRKFIDGLWKETVADCAKIDQELRAYSEVGKADM